MRNRKRNIIILSVVIALLLAVTVLVLKLTAQSDVIDSIDTEPELYVFAAYDASDVMEAELTYDGETTTIYYDPINDIYKLKEHDDLDINQYTVNNILTTYAYVQADSIAADSPVNVNDFGLLTPIATVRVTYNDDSTNTFYIGNKVPGSYNYYMIIDGIDMILNMDNDYGSNAMLTYLELASVEKEEISTVDAQSVSIYKDGSIYMQFERVEDENALGILDWELTVPYRKELDSEDDDISYSAIFDMIESISPRKMVAQSGNLSDYGLDEPWGMIEVAYSDGSTTAMMFGDEIDGLTMMKYADSDVIYSTYDIYFDLFDYNAIDLINRTLCMINIKTVSEIITTGILGDNSIEILHPAKKDDDGSDLLDTDGNVINDNIFVVKGVELTEDEKQQGSWYYQSLLIPKIIREVEDEEYQPSDAIGSLVYKLNDGVFEHVYEFFEYDKDFYAVKLKGNDVYLLVNKNDIDRIGGFYNDLVNREMASPYAQ